MKNSLNTTISADLDFIVNSDIDWEQFRDKVILITGSYGMLLSYMTLTFLWLNEGRTDLNTTIIAPVRNLEKARNRLGYFSNHTALKFISSDLSKPDQIDSKVDYIIHGASHSRPDQFLNNPPEVIIPNVIGTYHLLELARKKNVKSFLFFSSGAVYGKPADLEEVTEEYVGTVDQLDTLNCYAESKRMAENMCRSWYYQFGLPVKLVRPAHIYGPSMDIEGDSRVFAYLVRSVIKGHDILLKTDGSACRSFCYVADAVVAHFKVLLEGADGEAYNVGNDAAYVTIRELAEMAASLHPEKQLRVIINDSPDGPACASDRNRLLMSSRKIEKLGWQCAFSLNEGLQRTIDSFLSR